MKFLIDKTKEKPSIDKINFLCDGSIHPKLDKYDFTKVCFQRHSFTYCVGRPQSGKSNLVQNLFKKRDLLKKCYHNIFYISPSSSSIENDVFSTNLPDDHIFTDLNEETLGYILSICESSEKDEKNMIVLDDCASSLKDVSLLKMMMRIVLNRRHIGGGVSIIIISQSYNLLPLQLRKMINTLILFKPTFKEMIMINDEILHIQDKKSLNELIDFFFDKPFNFLSYNLDDGKYYKNMGIVNILK